MVASGRKPKPEDQRRNRNQPMIDWVQVVDVPYEGPVPSPGRLPAQTRRWWAVVSRMPHCVLWDEADWQFAIATALTHAAFVRSNGAPSYASELRRREVLLGLTWDARRDLRIRYVSPPEVTEDAVLDESPVSLAERRRELEA